MREYGLKIALAATLGTLAAMGYYEHVTKAPAEPATPAPVVTVTPPPDPGTVLSVVVVKLDDGRKIVVTVMQDGTVHEAFADEETLRALAQIIPKEHAVTIDPKGEALGRQPQVFHYTHAKNPWRCANVEWMTDENFGLWTRTLCSDI